jgi:colanic acid/amylovoran biosynthesis glycosyltransferase
MKIGIVLAKVPGYSETFFKNKVSGLIAQGHEIFLFVNTKDKNDFYGANVIGALPVTRYSFLMFILFAWHIFSFCLMHPIRCIKYYNAEKKDNKNLSLVLRNLYTNIHILRHSLDWIHFGFATLALGRENTAEIIGAKMATSIRGYDTSIYPLKNKGCYNHLWGKLNKIHVISDALKMKLYSAGFNNEAPVVKITPAIDVNKFIYPERQMKNFNGNVINILTVGRLTWKKGYEYGLEALAWLKERGFNFKYVIVGGGDEFERIKFAAYQMGLVDEVEFKGILEGEELIAEYKKADIYIQPSVQEGFCNAALEAQAAGCLCIVSDAEGLPENVLNDITGWVVSRRDVKALAEKIEYVINLSDEKKQNIIANAEQRVKKEFNLEKQVKEFIEFYEK